MIAYYYSYYTRNTHPVSPFIIHLPDNSHKIFEHFFDRPVFLFNTEKIQLQNDNPEQFFIHLTSNFWSVSAYLLCKTFGRV